jgi:hypothetical protein
MIEEEKVEFFERTELALNVLCNIVSDQSYVKRELLNTY